MAKKNTSEKVASIAGKILRNDRYSNTVKRLAGSALVQYEHETK
jgi:hypothetical protein